MVCLKGITDFHMRILDSIEIHSSELRFFVIELNECTCLGALVNFELNPATSKRPSQINSVRIIIQ